MRQSTVRTVGILLFTCLLLLVARLTSNADQTRAEELKWLCSTYVKTTDDLGADFLRMCSNAARAVAADEVVVSAALAELANASGAREEARALVVSLNDSGSVVAKADAKQALDEADAEFDRVAVSQTEAANALEASRAVYDALLEKADKTRVSD